MLCCGTAEHCQLKHKNHVITCDVFMRDGLKDITTRQRYHYMEKLGPAIQLKLFDKIFCIFLAISQSLAPFTSPP